MHTIILFPTAAEAAPFEALCPGADIRLCGVGMAACAAAVAGLLPQAGPNDRLILAGVAGAYGDRAGIGEVVEVASERTAELPERFAGTYRPTTVLTMLRQVASNTVHGRGAEAGGAAIENMEGAAFMAVCAEAGITCAELRAVSNRVGESFDKWHLDEAAQRLAEVLAEIYRSADREVRSTTRESQPRHGLP